MARTAKLGAVVAAGALVVSACGGGGGAVESAAASAPSAKSPATAVAVPTGKALTGAPEPAPVDDGATDGQMTVQYDDATTPEAMHGRDLMEKWHLLEGLAKDVNDSLKLPYDIPLVGEQCGEANDFWSPSDKTMTLCYEDVDNSVTIFSDAHAADPEAAARRNAIGAFYHELGHMVIDIYDLPATGREEDAADQMAAFALLQRDPEGNFNPDFVQAAKDTAEAYQIASKEDDPASRDLLADVHTLSEARMFNFECWIYGADPTANADIVSSGDLPEERADGCEDEYNQLVHAWSSLLGPHWK